MTDNIYKHVLIVGPEYRNHRGGIGAVIESHSLLFGSVKFIPTYRNANKYVIPFFYSKQLLSIFFYLLTNPGIKIVHIHGASRGSFFRKYGVFLLAKYLFSKKVIYHIHGGGFHVFFETAGNLTRNRIRHFIEKTDVLVCLSSNWEAFFRSRFRPKRLEVIRNFMNLPCPVTRSDNANGKVIFLFLGKIVRDKGIFDLLETVLALTQSGITAFELWIGGNGETANLEKFIGDNRLEDYIKYLGWVSGNGKKEVLGRANIYVLPSYHEGMPVSILETMAYGMPVISTKVGGIPELVQHNVSGFLIEPGDKKALRHAMETFLQGRDLIDTMGRKSTEIIENGFSAKIALQKLTTIYEELLNN
jgi:glycosyltransferase involved in cell wall biosynthesis